MATIPTTPPVPTFCALCVSRCGAHATIHDARLVALQPDPSHPTGRALCVKGKAAPELVYHPERLLHPLKRTAPKGAADPGWEQIGWDEALDTVADRYYIRRSPYPLIGRLVDHVWATTSPMIGWWAGRRTCVC